MGLGLGETGGAAWTELLGQVCSRTEQAKGQGSWGQGAAGPSHGFGDVREAEEKVGRAAGEWCRHSGQRQEG